MRPAFQLTRNIYSMLHICLLRYSILKIIKSLLFAMKDGLVVYLPVFHLLNSAVVWVVLRKKIRYHLNLDGFQWKPAAKTRQFFSFPHTIQTIKCPSRILPSWSVYGLLKSNKKRSTPDTHVKTWILNIKIKKLIRQTTVSFTTINVNMNNGKFEL
jgi:hypothetical protein